ncbi:MAG: SDR family NAD(P)-dependent oxidoreductase [Hyphomicrobiaceae bacterium]
MDDGTTAGILSLEGKSALVTGASSGLGRHFAGVLARAGAKVVLTARRIERLEELAAELRDAGHDAIAVAIDVTQRESVNAGFDLGEAAFGSLSVVVNNAGIADPVFFTRMTEDSWRKVLDVNLDGVFRVGQEAARRMEANGGGSIINIASVLGLGVVKSLAHYSASKGAVIQLTKAMALELARSGIRVNAIAPGYISTEMNADFLVGDEGTKLLSKVPMLRAGQLDELNGPLLLLASDAGSYMTGSIIAVDGGTLLSLG